MVWAAIVLSQVGNGFECRSTPASLLRIGFFSNRLLLVAIGVELAALMAFLYVPGISHLLGQRALSAGQWVPILAAPILLVAAEEVRKAVVRAHAGH
jgi:Ca2+-transporting ATPase